jgi:hypothetical protein
MGDLPEADLLESSGGFFVCGREVPVVGGGVEIQLSLPLGEIILMCTGE